MCLERLFLLAKDSISVLDFSLPRCHCQVVGRQAFRQTVQENGLVMQMLTVRKVGQYEHFPKSLPDWVQGLISLN